MSVSASTAAKTAFAVSPKFGSASKGGRCRGARSLRNISGKVNMWSGRVAAASAVTALACPPCAVVAGPIALASGAVTLGTGLIKTGIDCQQGFRNLDPCVASTVGTAIDLTGLRIGFMLLASAGGSRSDQGREHRAVERVRDRPEPRRRNPGLQQGALRRMTYSDMLQALIPGLVFLIGGLIANKPAKQARNEMRADGFKMRELEYWMMAAFMGPLLILTGAVLLCLGLAEIVAGLS